MEKRNLLKDIIAIDKNGKRGAIYSVCSSNPYVIEATIEHALLSDKPVLIESTANQVNQFGGYTGMRPADFVQFVESIANRIGFPRDKLLLGGDHLGPLVWKDRKPAEAMILSQQLVREYVLAGYNKIHIDTSMPLGGDLTADFGTMLIAERAAFLIEACEKAFFEFRKTGGNLAHPVYVIGSEVPSPGGIHGGESKIAVTSADDFKNTVNTFHETFAAHGLCLAWEYVIAVVVQLGVEFGNDIISEYDRSKTASLVSALNEYPSLAFEAHSTDYQTKEALRKMVEDGVSILKVGPALTFALREALFALSMMENIIAEFDNSIQSSNFELVLDRAMREKPDHWKHYYHGTENEVAFQRRYSFSDRCRYYLTEPAVQAALGNLIHNLRVSKPPLSLLSQYLPYQYALVRSGSITLDPEILIKNKIAERLDDYSCAVNKDRTQ